MSLRTISIGGATYDLFVRTPGTVTGTYEGREAFLLPLGAKVRVSDVIETCGGGASNTSVGLARLGCRASFSGVVGSDQWGEKLKKNMEKEGVDTKSLTVVENEVSSFSIILSAENGERVILYDPGTNEHLHDATFDRAAIRENNWVYLNHIQETGCNIHDDIVTMLAEETSVCFTWNPGGCQLDRGTADTHQRALLSHTDLLLVNDDEALKFTKEKTVEDAIRHLLALGVKNVCITQGTKGTLASDGSKIYHCPILTDVTVVDTTGAGDAFGCAATWALLTGKTLPEALRAGTINAASVVGSIGAQAGLLGDTEMQKRLQSLPLVVAERAL
jgi:ribokinase